MPPKRGPKVQLEATQNVPTFLLKMQGMMKDQEELSMEAGRQKIEAKDAAEGGPVMIDPETGLEIVEREKGPINSTASVEPIVLGQDTPKDDVVGVQTVDDPKNVKAMVFRAKKRARTDDGVASTIKPKQATGGVLSFGGDDDDDDDSSDG